MHFIQKLFAFHLCFITCTGGKACPELCTCTNTTLDCANQLLTIVPAVDGSFANISFSRNLLTSLSTGDVPLKGSSCTIDYSYNKLSRGISNLPHCDTLLANFSHNNFQDSLPSNFIFSNHGPDVTIDLSFNKLQTVEKNTFNLYNSESITIDLSHNMINHIDRHAFELRHRITSIHLKLSNNRITSFTQLTVYLFTTEIHLDMSDNLLTQLSDTDINSYSHLQINLARNPWSCDCHQSWIADSGSKFHGVLSNEPQELLCNYPPNTKARPALELSEEEFSCPPELDLDANLHITANASDTIVLQCPFGEAVPPVQLINWTFVPRTNIGSSGMISFSTPSDAPFQIHNVTCEWTGTYFCHVGNTGGSTRLNVTLSVNSLCKHTILTGLCVVLAILLILALIALTIRCNKTSAYSYVFKRSNKNQLSSPPSEGQEVMLAEILNKEVNSTISVKSDFENSKRENKTNSAAYSDIIPGKSSENMSHGKKTDEKTSKFPSNEIRGNFDASEVSLIIQSEDEQDQDQAYFCNSPLGPIQEAKMTNLNVNLPFAAEGTENDEMDEDMYLVPNNILTQRGPYLHSHDDRSGRILKGKETGDDKIGEIYSIPDQNLIPKTSSGQREGIPVYLEILPDKQMPSSTKSLETVKMVGLQTKTRKADNAKKLRHKGQIKNKQEMGNSQGQMNSEAIPSLMEEYMQKKHKQEKNDDGNEYFDVKQLRELCDEKEKGMKRVHLESKKEAGHFQEKDELDEEIYLIPNQPQ